MLVVHTKIACKPAFVSLGFYRTWNLIEVTFQIKLSNLTFFQKLMIFLNSLLMFYESRHAGLPSLDVWQNYVLDLNDCDVQVDE